MFAGVDRQLLVSNKELWLVQKNHLFLIRCDTIVQCPSGEDEESCHIPESARQIMSLFFILIIIILVLICIIGVKGWMETFRKFINFGTVIRPLGYCSVGCLKMEALPSGSSQVVIEDNNKFPTMQRWDKFYHRSPSRLKWFKEKTKWMRAGWAFLLIHQLDDTHNHL